MPYMLAILINKSIYSCGGTKRGKARNIAFKNISVTAPKMPPSKINGYDEEYSIDGLVFENITLNGETISSIDDMNITINEYVKNVTLGEDMIK